MPNLSSISFAPLPGASRSSSSCCTVIQISVTHALLLFLFLMSASCLYAAGPNSPTITSFTPGSGGPGTVITITGTNFFSSTSSVTIGGTAAASFTVVNNGNNNQISATVGSGATGTISVTTHYGTATSTGTFTYIPPPPPPTITSFSPTSAGAGSVVTLSGSYFTGATAVSFGGTAAVGVVQRGE